MRMRSSLYSIIILMTLMLLVPPVYGETITVCENGCDFNAIQPAINSAEDGDIIEVQDDRVYMENPVINKSIQLTSTQNPIISAVRPGPTVQVLAEGAAIEGFFIPYTIYGIVVDGVNNVTVSNCMFEWCSLGVKVSGSHGTRITNNEFLHINHSGVFMENSYSNLVENNSIGSRKVGIFLKGSSQNELRGNDITGEGGIFLQSSIDNVIEENSFAVNETGILLMESGGNEINGNNASSPVFTDFSRSPRNNVSGNSAEGIYARNFDSYYNNFKLGNLSLSGEEFKFSLFEVSLPEEYISFGEGVNITIVPDILTDRGSAQLEAKIYAGDLEGLDPSTTGFYELDNGALTLLSGGTLIDGKMVLNASINHSGHYALLGQKEETDSGINGTPETAEASPDITTRIVVAVTVLMAALLVLAYMYKRK